jgi:hypothetical protein
VLLRDKNKAIGVIPVLFLRGSGSRQKHRVLLYTAAPSHDFASLNRGSAQDARFAVRLLDQFCEEALHAAGEGIKDEDMQKIQDEAWAFANLESKAAAMTNTDEVDDGDEPAPVLRHKRAKAASSRRAATDDANHEASSTATTATASRLQQHLQDEKDHEKEHKKDLKKHANEIEDLKARVSVLEHQLDEVKKESTKERDFFERKLQKVKDKISASVQQQHLAIPQAPVPALVPFATAPPQAVLQAPSPAPFAPLPAGAGGYYYFPPNAPQGASRLSS